MKQCGSSASITAVQRDDEHRSDTRGLQQSSPEGHVHLRRDKTAEHICTRFFQGGSPHIQEMNPGLLLGPGTMTLHCCVHLEFEPTGSQIRNAGVRAGCPKHTSRNRRSDRMRAQVYCMATLHSMSSLCFVHACSQARRLGCNSVDARQGIVLQDTISADHLCKHGLKLRALI